MSALMSNFDIAREALEASEESAGSAMLEHAKWMESLEAALNRLHAAWEELSEAFLDDKSLRSLIDTGTNLLSLITKIIQKVGTFPTIATAAVGILSGTKGIGIFKTVQDESGRTTLNIKKQWDDLGGNLRNIFSGFGQSELDFSDVIDSDRDALEQYFATLGNANFDQENFNRILLSSSKYAQDFAMAVRDGATPSVDDFVRSQYSSQIAAVAQGKDLNSVRKVLSEYATGCQTCGLTQQEFAQAVATTNPKLGAYIANTKAADVSMVGYGKSVVGATIKTIALEAASIALHAALTMCVSLLLQAAASFIAAKWDDIKFALSSTTERIEKFNEALQISVSTVQDIKGEFDDLSKSANEVIPRFAELAKGVDKFGQNVSLTSEEYEEFKKLNNQIAEILPELKIGMDSNGDAMLNLSYQADGLAQSLYNIVDAARDLANQKIAEELPKQIEAAQKAEKDYRKDIKHYQNTAKTDKGQFSFAGMWDYISRGLAPSDYVYDVTVASRFSEDEEFVKLVESSEKKIKDAEEKIKGTWDNLLRSVAAYMQTSQVYKNLGEGLQQVATKIVGSIDMNDENIKSDLIGFIDNNILGALKDATPEFQQALVDMFNLDADAIKGNIDAGTFQALKDEYVGMLYESGLSDEVIKAIKLNLDTSDFSEKIAKVKRMFQTEYIDEVDKMSYTEIELAYKIDAANGSLTLDSFQEELNKVKIAAASFKEVESTKQIMNGLTDVTGGLQDIVTAMQTLQEGTALTTAEVVTLANTYPKLLEQANIFTDGTIDSQSKMLQYLLDSYETEYDALIDTKIAELRATNECLSQQADLERQKLEIVTEIQGKQVMDNLEDQEWLTSKIAELNNLQMQNYVTFENGILKVNEEALNQINENEESSTTDISNAWKDTANEISGFTNAAANSATDSMDDASKNVTKRVKLTAENIWKVIKEVGARIAYAFTHPFENGVWGDIVDLQSILDSAWKDSAKSVGTVAAHNIEDYYKGSLRKGFETIDPAEIDPDSVIKIDDKALDEWAEEQEKKINQRIEDIQAKFSDNEVLIANLEDLKGLDLKSIVAPKTTSSSGKTTSADKSSSDTSAEDALEEFNLIEIAIKRAQEATEKLRKVFTSTFVTLDKRVAAFKNTLASLTNEMNVQNAAAEAYKSAAEAIAISEDLKAKVRNGSYEVLQLDKETATLVKNYQELYEKYLDCIDAASELRDQIAELYTENFANIQKDYENRLSMVEHRMNTVQTQMDIVQGNGYTLTREYYDELIQIEYERLSLLQKEREEAQRALDLAVQSGEIEKYSETYYEMALKVNELDEAIQQCDVTLNGFWNDIGQLANDAFDRAVDQFDALIEESNFLIDLMADSVTDKNTGSLTRAGNATIDLHSYNYNAYLAEANKLRGEVERLNQLVVENPTNVELISRRDELLKKQRESIKAAQDEKKAIQDLVKNGLQAEADAMKTRIKAYTDYLDELSSVRDFQRTMDDDNDKISKLRKQIIAYENDTSDESKGRLAKLRSELEDAVKKKDDDLFKQNIAEQKKMLNQLETDYEEQINARMDNIDSYLASTDMSLSDISSILYGISADVASLVTVSDPITSGTIPHYASGGLNYRTGLAWLDGTASKPEVVLNQNDASNFLALRDALRNTSNSSFLSLFGGMSVNHSIDSPAFGSLSSSTTRFGDSSNSYTINVAIDHVQDYNDFVSQLQKDHKFEKIVQSFTLGRLNGKGSLDKYKY